MWCRAAFKAGGKREEKNNTHTYTHTQGRGEGVGGRGRGRKGREKKGEGVKEEVVRKKEEVITYKRIHTRAHAHTPTLTYTHRHTSARRHMKNASVCQITSMN